MLWRRSNSGLRLVKRRRRARATRSPLFNTKEGQAGRHHRDPVVPSTQGSPWKREADEWAKLAAEEPHACGVKWLRYTD